MKAIFFTLCSFLLGAASFNATAQHARFPVQGTIEFEKNVNMYALIKKEINKDNESYMQQAFDAYKKSQPQFAVLKSTLTFSGDRTLFVPAQEATATNNYMDVPLRRQINTVFSDLSAGTTVMLKNVYEEKFLVKDSVRKINWKLTSETREIAGYQCRRANAIIMDSIYVVAFYTDKIPVSGGPEGFSGLPGMILGVALPHDNVTWFAKLVTDKPVAASTVLPPAKGKMTDRKGLQGTLKELTKDWWGDAGSMIKALML